MSVPAHALDAAAATSADDCSANTAADADADADAMTTSGSKHSAVADIEVTIVESHANLKVLSRRRPRQLLRIVAGLQGHRLAVLHLNATSAGHSALYSLSLKVRTDTDRLPSPQLASPRLPERYTSLSFLFRPLGSASRRNN